MKHTILCVIAILTSCNSTTNTKQEMPTSVTADSATVISSDSTAYSQPYDSTSIDGTTAATAINKVSFNGTLIVPPQNFASVTMLMGGIIRSVNLLPGSYVKKGTLLASLDNPDFISLQQTFLESQAQTEYLKSEYNRQLVLSKEEVASVKKLEQSKADYLSMKSKMEAAAAQLSLLGISTQSLLKNGITPALEIKAPVNGYIGKVKVNVGKYLNEGDILCEIINKQETLLRLTTYEKDLKDIRLGAKVWFRVNGMGTKTFEAKLISIGQEVDETSRSLEVFAKVISEDANFRPGMYVTAQIEKD
ncbi:efflux RND transporter periplasmic adaptor subunit [Macellibacteroides fermentans]|uniref:RND family efflux transporter, MFP subunit n=1 Tax=Parabacteroides chartae TaxID=1037355 RepID=A0A1T5BXB3_9BACT|nr:efflux RND transporter periplasmic adaptor subunit [Parabacteroides chartae]SKB51777.1 RND family efflux transporter, MFP subunit [Parabacteroides chartae]